MKVTILYREKSEHRMATENFLRDLEKETTVKAKVLDADSREGVGFAELYGIMAYPAIVVTQDDGQLQRMWADGRLPIPSEVAGEAHT
jgi:hypothetical protein